MYTITLKQIIDAGYDIGLETYPCFNENYRIALNQKIQDRFYFNEIAFETPQRFIFELNSRMEQIMPKYNDMLTAYRELRNISFSDLLHNSIGNNLTRTLNATDNNQTVTDTDNTTADVGTVDTTNTKNYNSNNLTTFNDTTTTTHNGAITAEQTTDGKNLSLTADTPMSQISADLSDTNQWSNTPFVSGGSYDINNSGKNETRTTGTDTSTHTGTENNEHTGNDIDVVDTDTTNNQTFNGNTDQQFDGNHAETETTTGYNFDYLKSYQEIIDTIVNIDVMIMEELRPLFLTVY